MSDTIARKIKKAYYANKGEKMPSKPQLTIFDEDTGGYSTLHPTNGWQRVSGSRVRAQQAMMMKYGFIR